MLETPRKPNSTSTTTRTCRTPLKSPLSPDGEDTYPYLQSSSTSSTGTSSPYLAATKDSLHWFRARQEKWKTAPRPRLQKVCIVDSLTKTSEDESTAAAAATRDDDVPAAAAVATTPSSTASCLLSFTQTTRNPTKSPSNNKPPTIIEESEKSNAVFASKQRLFGSGDNGQESSSFGIGMNKMNILDSSDNNINSSGKSNSNNNNSDNNNNNSGFFSFTDALMSSKNEQSTDTKTIQDPFQVNNGNLFQSTTTTTTTTSPKTQTKGKPLFGDAPTSTTIATPFSFSISSTSQATTIDQQQQQPPSINATQTTITTATTTANSNSASTYRDRLIAFYKQHNPSKLDSIDATLQKYQGREPELFDKLQAKYTTNSSSTVDNSSSCLPATGSGPICFLKFSTGHSIQVELFADKTPFAAENFRCLCTGEKGPSYTNCIVHRIVPNFCIQAGDYTAGNGTGGKSIFPVASPSNPKTDLWGNFEDETPFLRHDAAGLLSMANNGPNRNSSQFFITLRPLPHLNGKHVVFGRVVTGMDAVEALSKLETDAKRQRPLQELRIVECGQVAITENDDSSEEQQQQQQEVDDDDESSSSSTTCSSPDATESNQDRSTSNPFAHLAATATNQPTPFGSTTTFTLSGVSSSTGSPFGFGASKGPWFMFASSKEDDRDAKKPTPFSFDTTNTEEIKKTTTTTTTSSIFGSSLATKESTQMPNLSTGRTHSDDDNNNRKEVSAFSFGSQTMNFNLSLGSGNSSDDKNIATTIPILSNQSFAPDADAEPVTKDDNVVEINPSALDRALDPTTRSEEALALEGSKLASKGIHSADEKPSFSYCGDFRDLQRTPSLSSQEHDSLALSDTSSSSSEPKETTFIQSGATAEVFASDTFVFEAKDSVQPDDFVLEKSRSTTSTENSAKSRNSDASESSTSVSGGQLRHETLFQDMIEDSKASGRTGLGACAQSERKGSEEIHTVKVSCEKTKSPSRTTERAGRKQNDIFCTPARTKQCIADRVSTGTDSCHNPSKTMASLLILDPLTVPVLHSMSPSRMRTGLFPPLDWGAVHLSSVQARTDSTNSLNTHLLIEGHNPDRESHFSYDPLTWVIARYSESTKR